MSPPTDIEILSPAANKRSGRRSRISVTQANQLALSRQDMGILTKRLLILAMSDITRDDYQLEPIRITAWEYAQLFGIRGKSIYSRIEESARELLEQTIQVKEPNGNWTMFQWVSEARYDGGHDNPEGMACIEIKIHEKLSPYLLQLRRDYSIIPTDQLLSFDSFNSTRLFEVLYTASYGGKRTPLRFDVDDLKKRMGLDGKYERFKDFRYVLDKAKKEFRKFTSLKFTYEPEKVGRKYQRVIFDVSENENFKPKVKLPESIARRAPKQEDKERLLLEVQALDSLREIGWMQDLERTLGMYGPERVISVVKYVTHLKRRSRNSGKPIENVAGLVATLLSQGFEPPAQLAAEKKVNTAALAESEARMIAEKLLTLLQQTKQRHLRDYWENLDHDHRDAVHSVMRGVLHEFTLDLIDSDDWQGMLYEASRLEVMEQHGLWTPPEGLRSVTQFLQEQEDFTQRSEVEQKLILSEIEKAQQA